MINEPPSVPETLLKAGVSLIPTVGGALAVIIQDISDRRAYKAQETLAWTVDAVGESRLRQLAESDSEFDALLADMMFAAVRTGLDNKRRVLAKVVANAATSDEPIDTAQLVVAALTELDGPHIRALARIRAAEVAAEGTEVPAGERGFSDPSENAAFHAGHKEPTPVLSTLVRTGVVDPATVVSGGVAIRGTTPFGRELLGYLEDESKPLS
ncbi:hypothetical protein LZP97_26840 (plasmid) [Rhodococcus sp. DMF-1]|uniref:hypothetical protein n=1 Tax=Rhodococcus TaxID=1827 RepID=UPI00128BC4CD|nr:MULTISPECIES: hypothetical protein [Rhodococcus]UIR36957.1 hypothetical protein LZP97_25825 [Rhodococcus sp. DMF-1]UIR39803.1 hypothetical protein LZP97_26840 [Rhodococcus sp. DMF-1]